MLGEMLPSVSIMFMCVVLDRSGMRLKRASVYFIELFLMFRRMSCWRFSSCPCCFWRISVLFFLQVRLKHRGLFFVAEGRE